MVLWELRTLTGAASDHSFPAFVLVQARHEIVGSTDFETEDFLQILSLEPYLTPQPSAQERRKNERSFLEDLVDF